MSSQPQNTLQIRENWITLMGANEPSLQNLTVVNLDQVRFIDSPNPDQIRLWFSETHKLDIHGPAALELFQFIVSKCRMTNGVPTPALGALGIF